MSLTLEQIDAMDSSDILDAMVADGWEYGHVHSATLGIYVESMNKGRIRVGDDSFMSAIYALRAIGTGSKRSEAIKAMARDAVRQVENLT